jgi:hypothetical protein
MRPAADPRGAAPVGATVSYRPDVSPDRRWIAYESFEPGRPEIYVQK